METDTLVLYPSPGIGHLIPMVELGKFMVKHHPQLSITILIATPPFNTGSTAPYIDRVSKTNPSIHFHHLPTVSMQLESTDEHSLTFEFVHLNNPSVHQALKDFSETSKVRALIIDMFCSIALDVANTLDIPTYFFYSSGISGLASYLYFPVVIQTTPQIFTDPNTAVHIPGLPPLLASDLPAPTLETRQTKAYEGFSHSIRSIPRSKGVIMNSFDALDPVALKALRDGLCIPYAPTPPVYSIGPLVAERDVPTPGAKIHESLTWLDSHPKESVVFLTFGSLGLFSEPQLKEIATGLEKSGQRFLWVVRSPPAEDKSNRFLPPAEPDLNSLLPNGFLDRTKDRGLVLKSWAPQVDILNHESVGGFVTHCGWNSVLEAICAGVPMVAWPLYAEQKMNRVSLVEAMKLALPMKEESADGFVNAVEVEKRVRQLMESVEGKMVREEMKIMSEGAKAAMSKGGSSLQASNQFVLDLEKQ